MRLVVLAAGQGFRLDGFHKLRIRDPRTGEPLIRRYQRLFAGWPITVVVGYQAISVMNDFPDVDYVYNEHWSITGNACSLALALDDRPCTVISSDLFFDGAMVELIARAPADAVFVQRSENQHLQAVRCRADNGLARELYAGTGGADPETIGIYKVSDPALLRGWKRACAERRGGFAGVALPLDGAPVHVVDKGDRFLHEVNTHLDFLELVARTREARP